MEMEAVHSAETSVSTCQATRHNIAEDYSLYELQTSPQVFPANSCYGHTYLKITSPLL